MIAFLKRNNELIGWISGIGIPIALVFTGWLAVNSVENSKLDSEYVKISLTILSAKATVVAEDGKSLKWTDDEMVLRRWAVRLINSKSPEKFSAEEDDALVKSNINLAPDHTSKGEGPIAFGQTISIDSSSNDNTISTEINVPQPYSREYPASDLLVTVTEVPDSKVAILLKAEGTQVSEGSVINVADLKALRLQDRTKGSGGIACIRYFVRDPQHRVGDATINIVINPSINKK